MISLQTLLSEATFETYFVQIVIKMKSDFNFTEIYNQVRGIKDVIVVKVIDTDQLDAASNENYKYALLEIKYISEGNAINTTKMIKHEALKIPGLVKFYVRTKTLLKIRNY
jgi:hypothetical protein